MNKKRFLILLQALLLGSVCALGACDKQETEAQIKTDKEMIVNHKETMEVEDALVQETEAMQEAISEEELLTREAAAYLEQMTLEEKVAQLFVVTPEALTGYGQVTAAGDVTKAAIEDCPVGGFVFLASNIVSPQQVTEMMTSIQTYAYERSSFPMFLCLDEEGGMVSRIGEKAESFGIERIGNMCDVGATGNPENAKEAGAVMGEYLHMYGINVDFAPVADVLTNPANQVVRYRSFGSDAQMVSDMVAAALEGIESQGVIGVLKHFPGHGATSADTHEGYAYTDKTLDEMMSNEMIPFINGIEAGADMIMTAHMSCPSITGDTTPCTLSGMMITDILRNRLGYEGIVITDAMNMGAIANQYASGDAAVKALEAGVDMILMPADFNGAYQGVLNAVSEGTITEARIDESVMRILKVKIDRLME